MLSLWLSYGVVGVALALDEPQILSPLTETEISLHVWKIVWSAQVAHFSSIRKEMRTLLRILENKKANGGIRVKIADCFISQKIWCYMMCFYGVPASHGLYV